MTFTLAKWGPFVFADDDNMLRGLKGVNVMVADLRPEIERSGLSKTQIQTDVELKLRMAGIKVLSEEEYLSVPGFPHLYVRIAGFKAEAIRHYVFSVSVELMQEVYLVRTAPDFTEYGAVTWSHSIVGISPKLGTIRAGVKDMVDRFIKAYLSVNPK